MASPQTTLPGSGEDELNIGQRRADELLRNENRGRTSKAEGTDASPALNMGDVASKERDPGAPLPGVPDLYVPSRNPRNGKTKRGKGGPITAIVSSLLVGVSLALAGFGQSSMLVSMMQNGSTQNDSSSIVASSRFLNVFRSASASGDLSNSALRKLANQGIVAYNGNAKIDTSTGRYPKVPATQFEFTMRNGSTQRVATADLPNFLNNNPDLNSRLLGKGGAFNFRVSMWSSKHITSTLFKKLGIKLSGGLADGKNGGANISTKAANLMNKLRGNMPSSDKIASVGDGVGGRVDRQLGKAKAGGSGYMMAVAGCIGVKAPGYIAAGVAAVQIAQVLPVVVDTILSPGSMQMASGVDPAAASLNPDDIEAINAALTNRTPREGDGKLTSALDSPILQSALGINSGKPPVAENLTPGFSALKLVQPAVEAERASKEACNVILSPAAMYTAASVDAAVTVAASATVIGGIVKVIGSFAIIQAAGPIASAVVSDAAKKILLDLATNDAIPNAEGQAFGDVLGISMLTFFPAANMANGIPTLQTGQLSEYGQVKSAVIEQERQMDIATLSPFDTTSRHTFFGSIAHSLATLSYTRSSSNPFQALGMLFQLPFFQLSDSASALNYNNACGYAAEFGLENTEEPEKSPAINAAGMPCGGITRAQADMSRDEAKGLMKDQGWLDTSISVSEDATILDMVNVGYIKKDTPLYEYIEACSDATTGDYIFNSPGCSMDSQSGNPADANGALQNNPNACIDNGEGGSFCPGNDETITSAGPTPSGRALSAIPVFMIDTVVLGVVNA